MAAGAKKENCFLCDSEGLIYAGRESNMNPTKSALVNTTVDSPMTLLECAKDADVLIGLSVENAFTVQMMSGLKQKPIVFALSNPNPEIDP